MFRTERALFATDEMCQCHERSLLTVTPTCLWKCTSVSGLPSICIVGCLSSMDQANMAFTPPGVTTLSLSESAVHNNGKVVN